jgi:predicted nucleotidyltransferase
VRLPPQLHAALKRRAHEEGLSLNGLCLAALQSDVGMDAKGPPSGTPVPLDGIKSLLGSSLSGVLLFGSTARGEAREGSDIDLLIVIGTEVPLTRSLYQSWDRDIGAPCAPRVSPHFVHLPDGAERAGSLWYEAAVDAVVLFEKDGHISRFLRTVRRSMADGTLQRKSAYGHSYWIRRGREVARVQ